MRRWYVDEVPRDAARTVRELTASGITAERYRSCFVFLGRMNQTGVARQFGLTKRRALHDRKLGGAGR